MVYDRIQGRVIIFGGQVEGVAMNDIWEFKVSTKTWKELGKESVLKPEPRHSMIAGYDENKNRVLITMGKGAQEVYNDVWEFSLESQQWKLINKTGERPEPRFSPAGGIFHGPDARYMYLTHGCAPNSRYLDDTWRFNLLNDTWENVSPPEGQPIPKRRCLVGNAMVGLDKLAICTNTVQSFIHPL
jgi:hypothetical protein